MSDWCPLCEFPGTGGAICGVCAGEADRAVRDGSWDAFHGPEPDLDGQYAPAVPDDLPF